MRIPNLPRGALIAALGVSIAVVTFAGPAMAAPYTSQPTISVSDQTPNAGSRLRVCGRDFHARTRVTISLDGRRLSSVRTDRSGAFCKTVRIPSRATGPHQIVAVDRKGASASVLINVVGCRARGNNDDDEGRGNRGGGDDRRRCDNGNNGRGDDRGGRGEDRSGRGEDRSGRGEDRSGRGDDRSRGDSVRLRTEDVSASSAIPVPGSTGTETSGLAFAGAAAIGIGAIFGGGLILSAGRRRRDV